MTPLPPTTELLVIGAGPYGLATAAAAAAAGVQTAVVGEPMSFWRRHMPEGMLLRSSVDWHLDPLAEHTLAAFLAECGIAPHDAEPLSLELFLDYADWFRDSKRIRVHRVRVADVRRGEGALDVSLEDGRVVRAGAVVATPGVEHFARLPAWVRRGLSRNRYSHSGEVTHLDRLAGARVLIVGGRQSAFEWAALLAERGAEHVEIVYRHPTPRCAPADWGFVEPQVTAALATPGWFRSLSEATRDVIARRFWAEERLKLEPWLEQRIDRPEVHRRAQAFVTGAAERADGTIGATLSGGQVVHADHVVVATGYEADLARVPYLAGVLDEIELAGGHPVLDASFQTSVPGLHVTGFAATQDFGPIFGFVRGATVAATIIARTLTRAEDRLVA
jgi:cation diffusion facilitator CzcD-associated flavoprotein CzcO